MEAGLDVVMKNDSSGWGSHFQRIACAHFYRMVSRLSDTTVTLDTGDFRLHIRALS